MRSPLLFSLLLAASITACNQPLTHDMSGMGGTGGTGTATGGGAGGANAGTGGMGGSTLNAQVCNTLVAEYHSAFSAAETCEVGASGQCQQVVSGNLGGCSCPTYVTDSAALNAITSAYQAAGCNVPGPPCEILCPAALNTTCVSADGGSTGYCSYVPGTGGTSGAGGVGATGGTSGAGGSSVDGGLSTCGTLTAEYAAVLVGARSCTAGATGQCGQEVLSSLTPCSFLTGCMEFVTDSSILDAIRQKWDAAGCGNVPALCPAIACAPPATAACLPSDGGGSVCSTGYQSPTTN